MIVERIENVIEPDNERYIFVGFETTEDEFKILGLNTFWLFWDMINEDYQFLYYNDTEFDVKDNMLVLDEVGDEYYVSKIPHGDYDKKVIKVLDEVGGVDTIKKLIVDYML